MSSRLRTATAATAACAALAGPAAAPALAAPGAPAGQGAGRPTPPAAMSALGGARLAKPGVQVQPGGGAPKLPKDLSGYAWMVSDADSGEILAANNAHWQLPPASTLKMLFADTVLPKFPKTRTHTVASSDLAGMGEGSSQVGIRENLEYSVRDLWNGVFLRSGNDAVHVLAAMNGGVDTTVRQMQRRAEQLGAKDTHVKSPDGYDAEGQVSSAFDLTLFARAGLKNADFRTYCATASTQFPGDFKKDKKGKKTGKRASFGIQNTDRLLGGYPGLDRYPGIIGVKNGYTTNAGNTFTGAAQRNGRTLIATVMHPTKPALDEVYKETARLFDWGFAADGKVTPVGTLNVTETTRRASKPGGGGDSKERTTRAASSTGTGGGLPWTPIGIAAGAVVVLGGIGWVLRRRRRPAPRH